MLGIEYAKVSKSNLPEISAYFHPWDGAKVSLLREPVQSGIEPQPNAEQSPGIGILQPDRIYLAFGFKRLGE